MCGRFTYLYTWKQLHRLMELVSWPPEELSPRFNVAPTQMAPVIRASAGGLREGVMLRWGLVPAWAEDLTIGNRLVNARGETIAEKPAFRQALAKRRCLVPVSGFYEWKTQAGAKQPFWIGRLDREPFLLAGLWEKWSKAGETVETFCLITTTPNPLMAAIHDRMPVIVAPADYQAWLDPANQNAAAIQPLIRPFSDEGFEARRVSRRVNSPKLDDPSLLEPDKSDSEEAGLFG